MKRIAALAIMALVTFFCAVSCMDTDSPITSGTVICSVINPVRLHSDSGQFLNIIENLSSPIPDTVKRVVVSCDVLSEQGNEYDIRVLDFVPITITEPVLASETDPEELGGDGLDATIWSSGGYLNALVSYTKYMNSETEHSISLVLDDSISGRDTLYLRLTHNAYGESFDNPEADISKLVTSSRYMSYDLDGCIPGDVQSIVLHIEYEGFITQNNIMIREKILNSGYLNFTR